MVFLFCFFIDFFTRINKDGNFFSIKKEKRIQFEIKRRYREFFFFFLRKEIQRVKHGKLQIYNII